MELTAHEALVLIRALQIAVDNASARDSPHPPLSDGERAIAESIGVKIAKQQGWEVKESFK